jgi:uncharacterized protein (DUF2062 family)
MIQVTKAAVRKWTALLLHTHDTPERTALAFAMGVFCSFSPFFGFHTIMAIVLAFVFGLNRVAALAGVYTNLPWFIGPYYSLATVIGAYLSGVALPPQFGQQLAALFELSFTGGAFWAGLGTLLRPLLWPFMIGSTIGATALAAVAYVLAVPAIVAGRRHIHLPHRHPHDSERS